MLRRTHLGIPLSLLIASTSFALPRPNSTVRAGANHHLGDDSYVDTFGASPATRGVRGAAIERKRMHTHLAFVRAWLAARPATRPELAKQRAAILGYFDAYIAKHTTPKNAHVPWRTPVFIDDEGTICAVGYLIEQSVGRALPERIAKLHRYDFIEDIAKAMPEVQAWVEASGFTLEEIATIQPAYTEPSVETWRTWDLAKHVPAEGAYDKAGVRGTFRKRQMEGSWSVTDEGEAENREDDRVVGRGTMTRGAGTWTSLYPDGKVMGEGPYVANRAHGAWKLFHPSGNLAAEGAFVGGDRVGRWRFYHDTPAKTPIAIGAFDGGGAVTGRWRHFDASGALLATSHSETPDLWGDRDWSHDGGEGFVLDIVARAGEVRHSIHQGVVGQQHQQLDTFALGRERIYVHKGFGPEVIYDASGFRLERVDGTWRARDCRWSAKRKHYAQVGDLAPLHGVLFRDSRRRAHASIEDFADTSEMIEDLGPTCRATAAVTAKRGARLDTLLASRDQVRALSPEFVRRAVLGDDADAIDPATATEDGDGSDVTRKAEAANLTHVLAANMSMYLEWPHIDGRFVALYATMAGRVTWNWTDGDPEEE